MDTIRLFCLDNDVYRLDPAFVYELIQVTLLAQMGQFHVYMIDDTQIFSHPSPYEPVLLNFVVFWIYAYI